MLIFHARIIGIALITLLSLSLNLDAAANVTAEQPNKGVILQQKRTERVEKAQDLAQLADRLRSSINAFNDV